MKYEGRNLSPSAVWGRFVDFPHNFREEGAFAPLVVCPNPNHGSTKRHFQINLSKPLVHCFANCGISGTYEHALCVIHGLYDDFKVEEAEDDRERLRRRRKAWKAARKQFILPHIGGFSRGKAGRVLRDGGKPSEGSSPSSDAVEYDTFIPAAGVEYLEARGIDGDSVSKWGLGWDAESLRIVIPAVDERGRERFVIRRAVRAKDQPKYLYPDESGEAKKAMLFGACQIDPRLVQSSGMVLVEGSLDAIRLHQHGVTTAVAILGSRLSKQQARKIQNLRPSKLYLMFDRDGAGVAAIESVKSRILNTPLFVCRYPKGKSDPAELSQEEAIRVISRAIPIRQFERRLREMGLATRSRKEFTHVGY